MGYLLRLPMGFTRAAIRDHCGIYPAIEACLGCDLQW